MCTVVNKYKEDYDVYIGRGSRWGNPFPMDQFVLGSSREDVIEKYRQFLWKQIKEGVVTLTDLRELKGKRLACYCAPQACHGDVIKSAVEWALKIA